MNYRLKKLRIKTPKRTIFRQTLNVKHGEDGLDGEDGKPGLDGEDGLSVVDAIQIDNNSFKFEFSNGAFSQQLALPKPEPGKDGKPGEDGTDGEDGKDAPTVVDILIFSKRIIFKFSDGSEQTADLDFPKGTIDNPGLAFGGISPTVKDILAGENITIDENNGVFTINSTGGGTGGGHIIQDDGTDLPQETNLNFTREVSHGMTVTDDPSNNATVINFIGGLVPYSVPAGETLNIPVGWAINACGPFELDGQINLAGRMCI